MARLVRELAKGPRERREHGLFLVEGPRGVEEALDAGSELAWLAVTGSSHAALVERARERGIAVHDFDLALLARIAPAEHGPGIVAACRLPAASGDVAGILRRAAHGLVVVCWQVQNPGNLGAILRSAAAFGCGGLVAAGGADPFGPKTVRASAGAIHRLPVARADDPAMVQVELREAGLRTIAAVARGGVPPAELDWRPPLALLLGAEVAGLPAELEQRAARCTIPTSGAVESLSVPIAGAILLAHAFGR